MKDIDIWKKRMDGEDHKKIESNGARMSMTKKQSKSKKELQQWNGSNGNSAYKRQEIVDAEGNHIQKNCPLDLIRCKW
jgi:hypothetical protein